MAISPRSGQLGLSGRPQATTDTLTIERLDAPDAEAPGRSVTVTATVSCQAVPFTNCEAAVRFTMGDQVRRVPESGVEDIGEAATRKFTTTFEMPESSTSIVVEALEQGSLGRFNVEDTAEIPVEAITQQEKTIREIGAFVPWAIGGGALGFGIAQVGDRPVLGGTLIGSGGGVASKVVVDQLGGVDFGAVVPEFPTGAVLATAALLGAGALLLWRLSPGTFMNFGGLGDILGGSPRAV